MRPILSMLASFLVLSGCAIDPSVQQDRDEGQYVTGSNIPRRDHSKSLDHVQTTTTLDTGVGISGNRGM